MISSSVKGKAPCFTTAEATRCTSESRLESRDLAWRCGGDPAPARGPRRCAWRGCGPAAPRALRSPGDVYTTDVDVFNAGVRTVVLLPPEHRSARQRALHRLLSRCGASSVALEEFAKIATGVRVDSTGTGTGQSRSPSAPVTTANGPDLLFGLSGNENVRPYTEASGWTALPEATAACGGATGNLTNTPATGSSRRPAATPTRRRSPWPSSGPLGSSPTSAADRARGSSRRALWSAGLPSAILPAACRG